MTGTNEGADVMPYAIQKRGNEFLVVRQGKGKGSKIKGRHPTKAAARKQQEALYAKTGGK